MEAAIPSPKTAVRRSVGGVTFGLFAPKRR